MGFDPLDLILCLQKYQAKYLRESIYHSKELDIEMTYQRARGRNYSEIGFDFGVTSQRAMRRVKFCANKLKFYYRQDQGQLFSGLKLGEKYLDQSGGVVTLQWSQPFPDYDCETRACSKNRLTGHNYIYGGITDKNEPVKYDFHGKPACKSTKHKLISALSSIF